MSLGSSVTTPLQFAKGWWRFNLGNIAKNICVCECRQKKTKKEKKEKGASMGSSRGCHSQGAPVGLHRLGVSVTWI